MVLLGLTGLVWGEFAVVWQPDVTPGKSALDVPRGFAHLSVFVAWYGVFEHLALATAVIICAYSAPLEPATVERLSKISRLVFGICLIYFGLAHHFYLANTVSMVPAWLPPGQTFWAYAKAAGYIYCSRHRTNFGYPRAPRRHVVGGDVHRIRHPGACSQDRQ